MMNNRQQKLCVAALKQTMNEGHHIAAFLLHTSENPFTFMLAWNGGFRGRYEEAELALREQLPFSEESGPIKTLEPQ